MMLDTRDMVTYLVGGEVSAAVRIKVMRALYNWAREGKLTNHGKGGRGQALWSTTEVLAITGPSRYPTIASRQSRPQEETE